MRNVSLEGGSWLNRPATTSVYDDKLTIVTDANSNFYMDQIDPSKVRSWIGAVGPVAF